MRSRVTRCRATSSSTAAGFGHQLQAGTAEEPEKSGKTKALPKPYAKYSFDTDG